MKFELILFKVALFRILKDWRQLIIISLIFWSLVVFMSTSFVIEGDVVKAQPPSKIDDYNINNYKLYSDFIVENNTTIVTVPKNSFLRFKCEYDHIVNDMTILNHRNNKVFNRDTTIKITENDDITLGCAINHELHESHVIIKVNDVEDLINNHKLLYIKIFTKIKDDIFYFPVKKTRG